MFTVSYAELESAYTLSKSLMSGKGSDNVEVIFLVKDNTLTYVMYTSEGVYARTMETAVIDDGAECEVVFKYEEMDKFLGPFRSSATTPGTVTFDKQERYWEVLVEETIQYNGHKSVADFRLSIGKVSNAALRTIDEARNAQGESVQTSADHLLYSLQLASKPLGAASGGVASLFFTPQYLFVVNKNVYTFVANLTDIQETFSIGPSAVSSFIALCKQSVSTSAEGSTPLLDINISKNDKGRVSRIVASTANEVLMVSARRGGGGMVKFESHVSGFEESHDIGLELDGAYFDSILQRMAFDGGSVDFTLADDEFRVTSSNFNQAVDYIHYRLKGADKVKFSVSTSLFSRCIVKSGENLRIYLNPNGVRSYTMYVASTEAKPLADGGMATLWFTVVNVEKKQ